MSAKGSLKVSKAWSVLAAGFIALAALAVILLTHASASVVLSCAAGATCLLWLLVLLTVPWSLYFQAQRVLRDIGISREQGLDVPAERASAVRRAARRLRWLAIGGHLVSAAAIAAITYFSGTVLGYYFAGFYLLSTLFRPAQAQFAHLRELFTTIQHEVRYPRDDVNKLKAEAVGVGERVRKLEHAAEHLAAADTELRDLLDALRTTARQRDDHLDGRVDALGRRFEQAVGELADHQDMIAGLKAFLRVLRTEPA